MQTFLDKQKTHQPIECGIETEIAIDLVKTTFCNALIKNLDLYKVTSPVAVEGNTGINDDLNGIERSVTFPIFDIQGAKGEVVQSLAKWKRIRLSHLMLPIGKGIVTDMKAIRPDEKLSPIHSIYVDQWDWEKVMAKNQRSVEYLKETVVKIYKALVETEHHIAILYPQIVPVLPSEIIFFHSQELVDRFPDLTPKEREDRVAKEFGAVFIMGIGAELSDGKPHDGRAPDYDDWSTPVGGGLFGLNGDIIVWNPVSQSALELSSMGIRVDEIALARQLKLRKCEERLQLFFHSSLMKGELPQSIGGGIGQSRVCMFLLRKSHIGEVQVGIWPNQTRLAYQSAGVNLI
jgi:aspartate--ammonia ligase